jgi:hypothetical protein
MVEKSSYVKHLSVNEEYKIGLRFQLIKSKLKRTLPLHVLLVMMGMLQLISEQTRD